jgi:enterochelin esterase family protein
MKQLSLTFSLIIFSYCLYAQISNIRTVSPDIQPDNSVIFRIKAPNASSVAVVGTFAVDFKPVSMVKNDSGIFEIKVGPLASDMYEYRFMLDSTLMLDPNNNAVTRDGSIVENRLLIPGKLGDLMAVQNVPHGKVTAVWYSSPTLGSTRRMYVYTPPGYEQGEINIPYCIYCMAAVATKMGGLIVAGPITLLIISLLRKKRCQ